MFAARDDPPGTRPNVISYLRQIWSLRHFWLMLIRIDMQNRYRRSVLGIGWSLIQPALMTLVLCAVFHSLFDVDWLHYAPFVFIGLTYWAFVNHSVSHGCRSFHNGKTYIRQKPAPMAIYPLRTVAVAGFQLVVATIVVLPLAIWTSGTPLDWPLLTLPFAFVLLLTIGWSLAVLSGVATVYFPDIEHLSPAALQVLFYATPVIYPASALQGRNLSWAMDFNPLAACLELLRRPLIDAAWPSLAAVGIATGFAAVMLVLAALVLARAERRLVFQL
jgi:lipopolysaccharide transport system permease protein